MQENSFVQEENINPEINKKMKECSICGKIIAKSAKRCPYCGAKNKKKFYKKKRFWILMIILIVFVVCVIPKDTKENSDAFSETTTKKTLNYEDVYEGDIIETDFVSITIDEISTTETIHSINSSSVLNSEPGEIYVYVKGKIKNTSSSSYNVGSMGSWSYDTTTYFDAELELNNGTLEYGSLIIDNGGLYGILSDGLLFPGDNVTYYIAFILNETDYYTYNKGEITIAFTENFAVAPSYDRANCDYLYRINY